MTETKEKEVKESWYLFLDKIDMTKSLNLEKLLELKKEMQSLEELLYLIESIERRIEYDEKMDVDVKNTLLKKWIDKKTEIQKKIINLGVTTGIYAQEAKKEWDEVTREALEEISEVWEDKENTIWYGLGASANYKNLKSQVLSNGVILLLGIKDGKSKKVAYRFKKDSGWTMDKAKTWVKDHPLSEARIIEVNEHLLMEAARNAPLIEKEIRLEDCITRDVFESVITQKEDGTQKTWEEFNDIPARMISPGMSLNGVFYYPEETLRLPETSQYFEACKGYSDHQAEEKKGEPRSNKDLACRFYGVQANDRHSLVAERVSFFDNDAAVNIRKILAKDPTALELSIAAKAQCREATVDGRIVLVVERFAGTNPSCDIVTEGARGGDFVNIDESLKASAANPRETIITDKEEGGQQMDFTKLPFDERLVLVKKDAAVMEALTPKPSDNSEVMKELSEARKEISELTDKLKGFGDMEKNFLYLKRKNDISDLEKEVMEHIGSKDFGETGVSVLEKQKTKWQSRIDELRSNSELPLFAASEAIEDTDHISDLIAPLIKKSVKASPDKEPEKKTEVLEEAKKQEAMDSLEELFARNEVL